MGMFDKLGGVKGPDGGGNWLSPGTYLLRVDKFVNSESKQGAGEFCAVEFTILEVEVSFPASQGNAPVSAPPDYPATKIKGESVSSVWMQKHGDVSVANLKGFLGACCGMDPNDLTITGAQWKAAAEAAAKGDGTALAGTILRCVGVPGYTRAKKPITKQRFSGVDEATAARFAA
jgi:hypothetical protein